MEPLAKSDMVTSQASKPANRKAAAISRSPLLPSSRTMATFGALLASCHCGLGLGTAAWMKGVQREAILRCSCSTQAGLACNISRAKELLSHMSRSSVILPSNSSPPALPTMDTLSSALVSPILTQETPAAVYASWTVFACASATSITRPSSSWNSACRVVAPASSGDERSTLTPQLPANAISRTAAASPPSLRSWPAEMTRLAMRSCVTLKAFFKVSATSGSQSAGTSPRWPKQWAAMEPPQRARSVPAICTRKSEASFGDGSPRDRFPRGRFRSGVTVRVTSGLPQ
mmetsp:Transcript_52327/g.162369  ORF Transcript_52327/g.162369 Transcript_52327/m.162369 type:complete len:288 (-) Transcript_52327:829-1692(-)